MTASNSMHEPKVPLARLYEKTSGNGNRYFVGRMGAARILLFHDTRADDSNVWQLYVQEAGDQVERSQPPVTTSRRTRRQSAPARAGALDWQAPLDDPLPDHLVR